MGAHVSVPMYRRTLAQRLRLEGARCTSCSAVDFPPGAACAACGGPTVPLCLSGRGRIHACTRITAAGAPPEFSEFAQRTGGYLVAIIALEEGPMITAQVVGADTELAPGTAVRAVIRRLYDEESVRRYGFKFEPAEPEHRGEGGAH